MKIRWIISALLVLTLSNVLGQGYERVNGLFGITNFGGEISLKSSFRQARYDLVTFEDNSTQSFLYANLKLNSQGFIWHPNFLSLSIGGELSPGLNRRDFLVSPDFSENVSLGGLSVTGTIFKDKNINLSAYGKWSKTRMNREFVTDLLTNRMEWGMSLNLYNEILPLKINYSERKWDQEAIQDGRYVTYDFSGLAISMDKSYSDHDQTSIQWMRNRFERNDILAGINRNIIDNLMLNNLLWFNKNKTYSLQSNLSRFNQSGDRLFNRTQVREQVSIKPAQNFLAATHFMYSITEQPEQSFNNISYGIDLSHKLFQSLKTGVSIDRNKVESSTFGNSNILGDLNINYSKKLRKNDRLSLSYLRSRQQREINSSPVPISIFNEAITLTDTDIVLLFNPHIVSGSIIIKDSEGLVTYQEGIDYQLLDRDPYIEVIRIQGGQIVNGQQLLVDYTYLPPGSIEFTSHMFRYRAGYSINNWLEFYYSYAEQRIPDLETTAGLNLSTYVEHLVGLEFKYKIFRFGAEYNSFDSNIIPFVRERLFLSLNGSLSNKLNYSLNGDYTHIYYPDSEIDQNYTNLIGNSTYKLPRNYLVTTSLGYRVQNGRQIDLDLFIFRTQVTKQVNSLFLRLAIEKYNRINLSRRDSFYGINLQVTRRF